MFDPTLEAHVAAAVRGVLNAPDDEDGALTHQLCEAARSLLEAFLQLSDEWDEGSFIDALIPMSVEGGDGEVELVAAAIVTSEEEELAWVEPLVAHFVLDGDVLGDVSLLFAYADREAEVFDPERGVELELPADADGFLYRLCSDGE